MVSLTNRKNPETQGTPLMLSQVIYNGKQQFFERIKARQTIADRKIEWESSLRKSKYHCKGEEVSIDFREVGAFTKEKSACS